jgi:phosphate acetyltransferase
LYLAPTGQGVGLTSVSLGLVRAFDRLGLRVGFCKPISQSAEGLERSTLFVRRTSDLEPPEPIPFRRAESLEASGRRGHLLEEALERFESIQGVEVVVVEGLVASSEEPWVGPLNAELARSLNAEVILISAAPRGDVQAFNERLELEARRYGGASDPKVLGVVVNKLNAPKVITGAVRTSWVEPELDERLSAERLVRECPIFNHEHFRLLGAIPWQPQLMQVRTRDVAEHLGAKIVHAGEIDRRRVLDVSLCARTVANITHRLRPEALLIAPSDRDDVILAVSMAALNGVPLAGFILTSEMEPNGAIMKLCARAFDTGLPVLRVTTDSYVTAARASTVDLEVPSDDLERIERVMESVAGHLDVSWLAERLKTEREPRMSPAAFMYQLVVRAREANRRIVLPEGDEPRTVQAAVICHERKIARCVLLAKPDDVQRVAEAQGLTLPADLEIIDPDPIRHRYVGSMVALRKHKGLSAPMAEQQLEDNVVLGTMMLAEDEVDGLVSGAVHTTANTIRPALQLIGPREGVKLVSSVFFMCLPDQVLVYGDCAINPDPNAEELADIAIQSAESAQAFGITPRVALLSYSTGESGFGSDVEKVREATRIARERRPDLLIDGPLQYDAASVASVAKAKAPDSPVAGRATVLVFPDLNTGNTTYKAVQRSAGVVSIGPMLQGLRKPVNDLSRGALVEDIVYTIALTAIQAQQANRSMVN